jgi:hypothetical protein
MAGIDDGADAGRLIHNQIIVKSFPLPFFLFFPWWATYLCAKQHVARFFLKKQQSLLSGECTASLSS